MKSPDGLLSEIKHLIQSTENGSTVLDQLPPASDVPLHANSPHDPHRQAILPPTYNQTSPVIQ